MPVKKHQKKILGRNTIVEITKKQSWYRKLINKLKSVINNKTFKTK